MKRSEYNRIVKDVHEFNLNYPTVITPADDEYDFTVDGCECCNSGACDTVTVDAIDKMSLHCENFDNTYAFKLCATCLQILINGDYTGLDFSVTEEDEPSIN